MDFSVIPGLLQNASILLAFAFLYGFFKIKNENKKHLLNQIGIGIVIGVFGIFLISTPWIKVPGITFDTRSVLLSVSGLFFGPVPTLIAMLETGAYRISLGGDGLYMGLAVIVTSGSVGLLWRYFRPNWQKGKYHLELIAMGIVVHVLMMLCGLLLPSEVVFPTLKSIAFPVLIIYPIITMLLGVVIRYQLKSWKIKQELDLSEERWKFALEGSGDGVWDWNVETNKVFYSKQWKEMLGFAESEINDTLDEWDKRVHPEDKEIVYSDLKSHLEGKTPYYKNEHRVLCKDGSYKWILDRGKVMEWSETGKPLRVIGTHKDISQWKKAENELFESNEKLQAFLDNSLDAILLASSDGKIYSANPAACKMLERTEEEICSLGRNGLVDTSDPRLLKLIDERAKTGKAHGELTMFRKGEKPFQVEISAALFKNKVGLTFSSMIIRDITERLKTQETIRVNEERFRLISGVASDYMFESRITEKGNTELVWSFGAFEDITGYKPEEFITSGGWIATIHPDDIKIDKQDFEKLQRNEKVITELRTITKNNKIVWIRVYAHPIWDYQNQKLIGIYGAVQDITERKNVEKALVLSEEKFRKAFITSPDAISLNRFSDGVYLEINNGFEKILGYTHEEINGKSSINLNIWKNPDARAKLMNGLNEYGFVENLEAEFVSKNGEFKTGLISASIIDLNNEKAILSITRDITERKIIESKLIENEKRFRTIFEQSASGMCLTSIEGKLITVNSTLCEMLSYSGEELVGKHFNSITHPDDLMIGAEAVKQMKIGITNKVVFEKRYLKKSGEVIWVHINSALLRDENNQPKYFVTQMEDITPRILSDLALKSSDNKFKALVEQSLTGIYIFEIDKFIYVNSRFCEIFGYSENEIMIDMKPTDVISVEDRERADENVKKRLNGEFQSVRYVAKGNHKTGKQLWVEIHGTHLKIEGKDVITGTVLDITDRKIAEEEIRKLNEELEEKVAERTNELEIKISEIQRMNKLFVGRELKMKELKEKIKEMENSLRDKSNN